LKGGTEKNLKFALDKIAERKFNGVLLGEYGKILKN